MWAVVKIYCEAISPENLAAGIRPEIIFKQSYTRMFHSLTYIFLPRMHKYDLPYLLIYLAMHWKNKRVLSHVAFCFSWQQMRP